MKQKWNFFDIKRGTQKNWEKIYHLLTLFVLHFILFNLFWKQVSMSFAVFKQISLWSLKRFVIEIFYWFSCKLHPLPLLQRSLWSRTVFFPFLSCMLFYDGCFSLFLVKSAIWKLLFVGVLFLEEKKQSCSLPIKWLPSEWMNYILTVFWQGKINVLKVKNRYFVPKSKGMLVMWTGACGLDPPNINVLDF